MPRRQPEASAREWLKYAKSDLTMAELTGGTDVLPETRCYSAQQAAEKALKAVCVYKNIKFPFTHDLAALGELLQDHEIAPPAALEDLADLSEFAVSGRYPRSILEFVDESDDKADAATALAACVLQWANNLIAGEPPA